MGKLQKRLSVNIATFLIITFATLLVLVIGMMHHLLEDDYIKYVDINCSEFRFLFEQTTLTKHEKDIALEKIGEMLGASIFICDDKGNFLYQVNNSDNGLIERSFIEEHINKVLGGDEYDEYNFWNLVREKNIYDGFRINGNDGEAAAFVVYNIAPFVKHTSRFFWGAVMALMVLLTIFIVIGHIFAGRILAVFEQANVSARKIVGGDYSQRIEINTNDELQDFADNFNKLAAVIGERIDTITEQKKELQEYARRQKEFTSNAAHELKNPLTSILASAELLKSLESKLQNIELLEMIIRNSTRLKEIVEVLLDLARAESGTLEENFKVEKFEVYATLKYIGEAMKKIYHKKKLKTAYKFIEGKNLYIKTSKLLFVQVCSNLLDNAAKYTIEEGTISINVTVHNKEFEISIENAGEIAKDNIPYIFERFYRAKNALEGSNGGVGLGLALTKQMVNVLGGNITVESAENVTKFIVKLPT